MRCDNCGKDFESDYYDIDQYIYKMYRKGINNARMLYFCGFKCREEARRKFEEEDARRRKETAEKRRATIERKKEMQNGQK